jgi:hypothetical protein
MQLKMSKYRDVNNTKIEIIKMRWILIVWVLALAYFIDIPITFLPLTLKKLKCKKPKA